MKRLSRITTGGLALAMAWLVAGPLGAEEGEEPVVPILQARAHRQLDFMIL